jgi:manganese/zinc/iron transport system substrate-binding protein
MRQVRLLGVIVLLAGVLAACGQSAQPAGGDLAQRPVRAVATIGMVADVVENIGGERVEVTGLMGPGVDPHQYKASAGDVERLQQADIVFYNGLNLEAAMGEVLERMQGRVTSVAVTSAIDRSGLIPSDEYENQFDPHVWFDVALWRQAAERVRDALVELDPSSAALYRANADRYLTELDELHTYVQEQAARVPEGQRVIITAHDAFRYFGRAYGFEVRGLQGISTATEAGTGDVQELAAFIAERQIPAIFVESSVPQRNIEAVQAAVASRGFTVTIGGELYSDAMGDAGTPSGTYIGMVRHNIDTIVAALTAYSGEQIN